MPDANPFQAHAANVAAYQAMAGGSETQRDQGAILKLFGKPIPCSHTSVIFDSELMPGGMSMKTFVEQVEFLAADVGNNVPRKGELCTLRPRAGGPEFRLRLWSDGLTSGGLLPGGLVYRFAAVDEHYKA